MWRTGLVSRRVYPPHPQNRVKEIYIALSHPRTPSSKIEDQITPLGTLPREMILAGLLKKQNLFRLAS